jgi:gliding motility associated protien GldN
MKMLFLKYFLAVLMVAVMVSDVTAQTKKKPTRKRKPAATRTATKLNPFGNAAPNKRNAVNGGNSAANPFGAPSGNNSDTSGKNNQPAPYVIIPSKGGSNPLMDSTKISLRNDNGIGETTIRDRVPLEYDFIREDDAVYKQRIWSVIDTREKMNVAFRNPRSEDNGSQLFFAILFRAVTEGGVTAFEDERFTIPISKDRFIRDYSGGLDTFPVTDLDNPDKIIRYEIRSREFPVDSIYQFMIKEDVIFDKEASRMVRRIIGIAPMMPTLIKGKVVEGVGNEAFPKFWLYYPDLRAILAKYRVFNPKNFAATVSWEDLL